MDENKFVLRPDMLTRRDVVDESDLKLELAQQAFDATRKLCACGRMFTPYRAFQRYCCDAHRIKYSKGKPTTYVKKQKETKICKQCGRSFDSNDSKRHYCSQECYLSYQALRHSIVEQRTCMQCGTTFETSHWLKRYCSEECRIAARKGRRTE